MNILSTFYQFFGDWFDAENKKNVLALFVVVKFFAVVGFVGFLVWTIRKNAAKQDPDTTRLLDELDREGAGKDQAKPAGDERSETGNEWERDPDWWKK